MKKAIIVEYSFMTRIVIDEENEDLETIVAETKQKILDKVNNELSKNLCEWYADEEMPYDDELFSNCCGYSTIETDMGICPQCLEHCDFVTEEE